MLIFVFNLHFFGAGTAVTFIPTCGPFLAHQLVHSLSDPMPHSVVCPTAWVFPHQLMFLPAANASPTPPCRLPAALVSGLLQLYFPRSPRHSSAECADCLIYFSPVRPLLAPPRSTPAQLLNLLASLGEGSSINSCSLSAVRLISPSTLAPSP